MSIRDSGVVAKYRTGNRVWLVDQFAPNQKQIDFFRACEEPKVKEILFDGSIRGGKSQACAKKIVGWAMRYRGTYVVMRATLKELEDSTKKIMLTGDGVMPPSIPAELIAPGGISVTWNKVTLVSGSEIWFRSLESDERGKIRNVTFAGGFIDQVEELDDDENDEEYYDELLSRLSHAGTPRKMLLAANPEREDHWVCKRFGCTPETELGLSPDAKRKRRRVHVDIHDNADNLDPDYVDELLETENTRPDFFKRMVLGLWGAHGGKRFKTWNPALHVADKVFDIPSSWDIYEGLDYGNEHYTASVTVAIDFDGRWWVVAEHFANHQTISWHSNQIKKIRRNKDAMLGFAGTLEPSATWLDPSAWEERRKDVNSVAKEFADNEIYAARASNARIAGWNRIEEMLNKRLEDGLPKLRFFPTCPNVIREIANARIKPGTDDVMKVNDDALDALRYIVNSRAASPLELEAEENPHTREAAAKRLIARATAPPRILQNVDAL